jgi:hypothetical protein
VRCGTAFIGHPKSLYCERCAWEAEKEAAKKYRDEGPKRKLGSIDKCEVCGKEYVVKSGAQRFCKDCAENAIKEKSRKRKREYNKTVYAEKRKENRAQRVRVCMYCGAEYTDRHRSNYCSDYCKKEAQRLSRAYWDLERGSNRDVKSLEEKRLKYREEKRNEKNHQ